MNRFFTFHFVMFSLVSFISNIQFILYKTYGSTKTFFWAYFRLVQNKFPSLDVCPKQNHLCLTLSLFSFIFFPYCLHHFVFLLPTYALCPPSTLLLSLQSSCFPSLLSLSLLSPSLPLSSPPPLLTLPFALAALQAKSNQKLQSSSAGVACTHSVCIRRPGCVSKSFQSHDSYSPKYKRQIEKNVLILFQFDNDNSLSTQQFQS